MESLSDSLFIIQRLIVSGSPNGVLSDFRDAVRKDQELVKRFPPESSYVGCPHPVIAFH
jgi:hypothetical protein